MLRGAETPKQEVALIQTRLAAAEADHQKLMAEEQARQAPENRTPLEIPRKPYENQEV